MFVIFIGPRCPWGPIYGSGPMSLSQSVQDYVQTLGVEQDFVIHQEFLIPGVLGGYLECIHFSELIGV